jgi:nitrogenase molybdenum-cofactor synthesis protein NifE
MAMDGKELVAKLAKLSQVQSIKDIPQLTHALFPGTHCPLMGAAMAVGGINDSLIVVVGTDECTYYTKSMTVHSEKFGGIGGRCVSVVLDDHDVTFGSAEKVQEAFKEIIEEYRPQCVFLVTTCVIEIIGDDFDAIAEGLSELYGIPVLPVHTEHFKCEDHLPGLERTISVCAAMIEPRACDNSVNLLGQRMGDFATTELYAMLQKAGIKIGLQLPCGCTVDDIKNAAAAKVNIVVNDIALPLAQKMQEKFGTPYVYFNKFVIPEKIYEAYKNLFGYLELEPPEELEVLYQNIRAEIEKTKSELAGITYIYGNTPYAVFEMNCFLSSLGMVPQVIQTNRYTAADEEYARKMLQYTDPYICKAANIAPLQYVYDVLSPYLYLGHEFASRLRQKGMAIVHSDRAGGLLGFEVTGYLLQQLVKAVGEAKEYRRELGI